MLRQIGLVLVFSIFSFLLPSTSRTAELQDMTQWAESLMDTSSEAPKQILSQWLLPNLPQAPGGNRFDKKKIELGKMLFFDPRLSGDGTMSCATCHNPELGWSDGLATAKGHKGKTLKRATPTIINVGFNKILMWDGRAKTLEDQAMGPIVNPEEMHNTVNNMLKTLKGIPGYVSAFKDAFYGLGINQTRVSKALAMYQRMVVSNNSPFDHWLQGDDKAMTPSQIRGFKIFLNPSKGNCAVCHRPPSFTDNGFHNIGLASFGKKNPDLGRHHQVKVGMTRGAFKTPPLRNIAQSAPYFHDGSAATLEAVVDHYANGGVVQSNLSPNFIQANLDAKDKKDLVAFLKALTGKWDPKLAQVTLPE
ncbi:MAG: tryptophan tryptophylquinone biosynthesis enzyme MauG [Gammaproteobacteria bacterium]|nr:tryptophan tryptophylquinone biosynthesis enzyme MauG [Gammaproteobacteria bacterium]MDH5802408.1 tryptophan tryptophylquinone biosynthesis enzyme MauG [Gammaproteobacteria bacterium]